MGHVTGTIVLLALFVLCATAGLTCLVLAALAAWRERRRLPPPNTRDTRR